MALVMLPCDLPWWAAVQKQLRRISNTKNTLELVDGMQKIHDMCNVSLDPDEDETDPQQFTGLLNFLDNDLTSQERSVFLNRTLPELTERASNLKLFKPKRGLLFSLQQQPDSTELDYKLVASLLANAFFSTFPKRTDKTHPTLQNFNFSDFFGHLASNCQKAKLRSFLHYFDWLKKSDGSDDGTIKLMRQVMGGREWLTIEDWLECTIPLCPLRIRHEGRLERSSADELLVTFASTKPGGRALGDGSSQECNNMFCMPETLCALLHVELLEDNEVLTVENVRRVGRIVDPKNRAKLEKLEEPEKISTCFVDAEDYSGLPLTQYEEDNVLRELNKCLLAYQQRHTLKPEANQPQPPINRARRLSPIGESVSLGSNQENSNIPIIVKADSCSTNRSDSPKRVDDSMLRVVQQCERVPHRTTNESVLNNRRGRFIVLGSSGECLPVKRAPAESVYSSCDSSEEEFHSAKASLDEGSEEEDYNKRYSNELETPERRHTFAERLRDALRREASSVSVSSESSYAVGITVAGSGVSDADIRVRRGGSTGFMLDDSLDERFPDDSLRQYKTKQTGALGRKESNRSSEYSFSTDYSSELEEVYEQFTRWLENPVLETDKGTRRELDAREMAVVQFAGSILKRTLSDSFAGVPMVEDGGGTAEISSKRNKLVLNAKSLSLELARHKHRLAAQLLSQIAQKPKNGLKAVSTGNWGCGSTKQGDPQLKVAIQWLSASVAGVPNLTYYTCNHPNLASFDTLYRLLRDRRWTVKDLTEAVLRYSSQTIQGRNVGGATLFEDLIGVERNT